MRNQEQIKGRIGETYYGCKLNGLIFSAAFRNEWSVFDREGKEIGYARNLESAKKNGARPLRHRKAQMQPQKSC